MLTKLEITKKKAQSSEQLDLVETITSSDILRKKRIFIIISILITIGLSSIFLIYRYLMTTKFSVPEIPKFTPISQINTLDSELNNILGKDRQSWEITVDSSPTSSITDKLLAPRDTFTQDLLPQGLDLKENYTSAPTSQTLTMFISSPAKKMLFSLKYNSSNLENFKSTLTKLIPAIYWFTVQAN